MSYLLLGNDRATKDQKIAEFKKKYLSQKDALHFDYQLFWGNKLDPKELKKSLVSLPVISSQRLIIIRQCEKLNDACFEIVTEFLQQKESKTILILDTDEAEVKKIWTSAWKPFVKTGVFALKSGPNVFDVTNAMAAGKSAQALDILNYLLKEDVHPLQIMGGIVWFWGRQKMKLHPQRFKEGLKKLQQTDENIKRSRLQPEHAVEKLVVELTGLMGS